MFKNILFFLILATCLVQYQWIKDQSDKIDLSEKKIERMENDISRLTFSIIGLTARKAALEKSLGDRNYRLKRSNSERKRIEHYLTTKYFLSSENASILAGYFYDAKRRAENRYDVKLDINVLVALTHTESRFKPHAVSSAGAIGVMQVVPRWHLHRFDFLETVDDLRNPRLNIRAGVFIFAEGLKKYGTVRKAIRAYHGGPRGVTNPRPSTVAYENAIMRTLGKLGV